MIVFDVCSRKSFESLPSWLQELEKNAEATAIKIIVGNNCEKEEKREVDYRTAKEFCERLGISYIECSAKKNINVEKAFMELTEEVVVQLSRVPKKAEPTSAVIISGATNSPAKRTSFC